MEIPLFDYTKKKYTSEEAMAFEDAVERLVEETLKTLVLFLEEYSFETWRKQSRKEKK